MPAISKYNKEYHDNWAWSLAMKGATDEEIASAFGISVRTLHRWKIDYPSFNESLTTGKEASDSNVEKSLYRRAIGYNYDETEKIVEVDRDGNTKPVKVRTVSKHISPDTMAIMYWLNNRKKQTGEWTQRQEIELSGSVNSVDLSHLSDEDLIALARAAASEDGNKE